MDLSFASTKIERLCLSEKGLVKRLGTSSAKKAKAHIATLIAVERLAEMRELPGRCHELSGDLAGLLALDLSDGKRLILRPTADPPPTKDDGGLDWAAVDAICIVDIDDYH